MKINRTAVILVLFVVLSHPLFANQEGCQHNKYFVLGKRDAQLDAYPDDVLWGVLSFGCTVVGSLGGFFWAWGTDFDSLDFFWIGGGIGAVVSIAVPFMIKPHPERLPDYISEEEAGCYLDGYGRQERLNNTRGAIIGSVVGWGGSLVLASAIALFYWLFVKIGPLE